MGAMLLCLCGYGEPASDPRPPASDIARFCSRTTADEMETFARAHVNWVKAQGQLDLHLADYWFGWREEAESLRLAWGLLRDAHDSTHDEDKQRRKLLRLRESIGERAYFLGCMPPPVPVWRFKRLP